MSGFGRVMHLTKIESITSKDGIEIKRQKLKFKMESKLVNVRFSGWIILFHFSFTYAFVFLYTMRILKKNTTIMKLKVKISSCRNMLRARTADESRENTLLNILCSCLYFIFIASYNISVWNKQNNYEQ